MSNFAIVGVAGYIARRHIDAIRRLGGDIVAAVDPFDSVGQMNDFRGARFFTDFAEFASYVESLRSTPRAVDYVVVCSPNYLHRAHIQFALRAGAHVICEKPLAMDPEDVDAIVELEKQSEHSVNTILQLRLNPDNIKLRDDLNKMRRNGTVVGDLTYVTSRSQWYFASWKGDTRRSGGVATNIGVHFFDLLTYFFGPPTENIIHHRAIDCAAGLLKFKGARISWFLSINGRDIPSDVGGKKELNRACRRLVLDDRICDLSGDFTELHYRSYEEILSGRGFATEQARSAIEIVHEIRHAEVTPRLDEAHPLLASVINDEDRYEDGLPIQS